MEEQKIVEFAMSGDKEAFTALYSKYYKDIYKFACFMLGRAQEAEDVVADAVLDIWLGLKKLKQPEKFKSWAFAIVANKCKKRMRSRKEVPMVLEEELEGVFDNKSIYDETMENFVGVMDARKAYAMLNAEEKSIVAYAVFAGYDSGEISEIMKVNRNTVRSKLSRALNKMREQCSVQMEGKI